MENKILELLEKNGQVSMNDDILPMLWEEFKDVPMGQDMYISMSQYIEQLLCACVVAGMNVVAVPMFSGDVRTNTLIVADFIYKKL